MNSLQRLGAELSALGRRRSRRPPRPGVTSYSSPEQPL